MGFRDDHHAESLFNRRFGGDRQGPEPQAGPPRPGFEDIPLRLTDERFAAEESRLEDFRLRTGSLLQPESATVTEPPRTAATNPSAAERPILEAVPLQR